jgi:hypothetical protein
MYLPMFLAGRSCTAASAAGVLSAAALRELEGTLLLLLLLEI